MSDTDPKSVAATLRAVAAAIDEGQPITSGTFLATLADVLDGTASVEDDEEPVDDVEQELPTFQQLLARSGGSPTIMLEREPVITDMPIPGEYRDAQAELADMF